MFQAIDAIETDKKTPYSKGSLSSGPHALSSAKYSRMEAEVSRGVEANIAHGLFHKNLSLGFILVFCNVLGQQNAKRQLNLL